MTLMTLTSKSKSKSPHESKAHTKAKKARNDLQNCRIYAEPTRSSKSINVNVHLFAPSVQRDRPSSSRTTLQNSCTIDKWIRRRYCLQMKSHSSALCRVQRQNPASESSGKQVGPFRRWVIPYSHKDLKPQSTSG